MRRARSVAKKVIKVSKFLGRPKVPGSTKIKIQDTVALKNDFDEAVRWVVPEGVFDGGAVDERVEAGEESLAKTPVVYEFEIRARYQVTELSVTRRRRRRGRVRRKLQGGSDPIIIIET
jgi:hypothetical protein